MTNKYLIIGISFILSSFHLGLAIGKDGKRVINPHYVIINLAYLVEKDPFVIEKMKRIGDHKVVEEFNKIIKGYSSVGVLTDFLSMFRRFCILKPQLPFDECSAGMNLNHGNFLYLTEPTLDNGSFLMVASFDSPERTMIFKWSSDLVVKLLYDSFSKKNICTTSNVSSHLRVTTKIRSLSDNIFVFSDSGNSESEYKRTIVFVIDSVKCEYHRTSFRDFGQEIEVSE